LSSPKPKTKKKKKEKKILQTKPTIQQATHKQTHLSEKAKKTQSSLKKSTYKNRRITKRKVTLTLKPHTLKPQALHQVKQETRQTNPNLNAKTFSSIAADSKNTKKLP
jgi:hypothetical protein